MRSISTMISTNVWVLRMSVLGSITPNMMLGDALKTVMERRLVEGLRSRGMIYFLAKKRAVMQSFGMIRSA